MSLLRAAVVFVGLFVLPKAFAGAEPRAPVAAHADSDGDPVPAGALARLGTIRLRHSGSLRKLMFFPDGKTLLANSDDGQMCRWDLATGRELWDRKLPKDRGEILSLAPDGQTMAAIFTGEYGLYLWSLATGTRRRLGASQEEPLLAIFSPDGSRLAEQATDGVRVWNVADGRQIRFFPNPQHWSHPPECALAFSPDGKCVVGCGRSHTIAIWDIGTGREQRISGRQGWLLALAYLPNGKRLLSGGDDGRIRLWDVATGREAHTFTHEYRVRSLAVHPGGQSFVSAANDNRIRWWDLRSGRELRWFPNTPTDTRPVAFSPDGSLLAAGGDDHRIHLWQLTTGREIEPPRPVPAILRWLYRTSDPRTLIAHEWFRTAQLWDVRTGKYLGPFPKQGYPARTITLSADGKRLALVRWKGNELGGEQRGIEVWDWPTQRLVKELKPASSDTFALALSPDGRILAAGGYDTSIQFWELPSGREIHPLREQWEKKSGWPTAWMIGDLQFSQDGRFLITHRHASSGINGWFESETWVWSLATGKRLQQFDKTFRERCKWAVMAPQGDVIAGNALWTRPAFQLTDVATGRELHWLGWKDDIHAAAFSPDGKTVAAGCMNGDIALWNVATGKEMTRLRGHRGPVHSLLFAADGSYLASSSDDATGLVWDLRPANARREK